MKDTMIRLIATMTAGALTGVDAAFAGNKDFNDVTNNIVASGSNLPNLVSAVAYVGGIGLGVSGIFKLKQHVENPQQAPMKDGLIRMGSSGALLALPFVTETMANTVSAGSTAKISPDNVEFNNVIFRQ